MFRSILLAVTILTAAAAAPASAQPKVGPSLNASGELNNCPIGLEVLDRRNQRWTITADERSACRLRNANGENGYSLAWMLRPAGGPGAAPTGPGRAGVNPAASGTLAQGIYVCNATGAGIFRVTIRSGSAYESAGTSGGYSISGGTMTFASGSLQGQAGRVNHPTSFSLATSPGRMMYTTCDKQ